MFFGAFFVLGYPLHIRFWTLSSPPHRLGIFIFSFDLHSFFELDTAYGFGVYLGVYDF